jgi:hypothetical protein
MHAQQQSITDNHHPRIRPALLLVLLAIALLAPFASKPAHIDDPLFIWTAAQIQQHPLNFYGFPVNWYGFSAPIWTIAKNPPLDSYFIAAMAALLGWRIWALHLAFIGVAIAAVLGTYKVAQRLCGRPALAAAIALVTPVFLVSSTSLMCDTMMLAFFVWAIAVWIAGCEEQSQKKLALAAIFILLGALTKYFALALVPLLITYSFARNRKIELSWLWMAVPIAGMSVYEILTRHFYGTGLISSALFYASREQTYTAGIGDRLLVGLAFAGGCLAPILFFAPALCWHRSLAGWIAATLALTAALPFALPRIKNFEFAANGHIRWGLEAQFAIWIVAGAAAITLTIIDWWRERDANAVLLALWFLGTFIFAAFINWGATGRTFLPAAPAIAILMVRRLERSARLAPKNGHEPGAPWLTISWSLAAGLAIAIALLDYGMGRSELRAATVIMRNFQAAGRTIYFEGHWGFQYYMQLLGGQPLDYVASKPQRGDLIVIPGNNTNTYPLRGRPHYDYRAEVNTPSWGAVESLEMGAGYYVFMDQGGGPLPFVFGAAPKEPYYIHVWK